MNNTAGQSFGTSHTLITLLREKPLHLPLCQVWRIFSLFLEGIKAPKPIQLPISRTVEERRKVVEYVVSPFCKLPVSNFLTSSFLQIYHEAPTGGPGGASPGGRRGYCRKTPNQEDQEGAGQSAPRRWHQGPIWFLLQKERRLLSWQRWPMHSSLPGHHLLLWPVL